MNADEHIRLAEGLVEAAKQVSRDCPKDASPDERRRVTLVVQELLDFAGTHALIAQALR